LLPQQRARDEIERLARDADAGGWRDTIHPMLADVTREDDCAATVAAALERFGRLDILVNNAGRGMRYVSEDFLTQPTRFWETPAETWRLVIETNVVGPFLMARAAVPSMLAHRWGRIVNISMNTETMRRRGFSPYGPSKAALESATVIWAQDLADRGITVNALLPGGATLTGMIPQSFPDHLRTTLLDPEIMVPPLLWIASIQSDGITGRRFVATKWRADDPEGEAAGW
jgi:NAD(P)-dependent dehydrogenase (short-subunit alcohol dehydrogenase family)